MSAHRATGKPRGRPRRYFDDFGDRIMDSLRARVDPETGLARPLWGNLVRELGVSRSTISRHLARLREKGAIESVFIQETPEYGNTYYRLKECHGDDNPELSMRERAGE